MNVKLKSTIYGFLYRDSRYGEDEYYFHFYDSRKARDDVAGFMKDGEVHKFEIKVRDLLGE